MGELRTLAKARQELEDLYVGVPDESVNLSFQHLAQLEQKQYDVVDKKKHNMEPIDEVRLKDSQNMGKSPSLDFSKALHASRPRQQFVEEERRHASPRGHHHQEEFNHDHAQTPRRMAYRNNIDNSIAYDDMSIMSGISRATYPERRGRRAGIPHSNICTICSTYTYIFRHRCLVCGRVYCRNCVEHGMGEMTEGRKCVECLGRKFSQRYIQRAGNIGCCATGPFGRYPTTVKLQEIKWAEKGPRRSRSDREREGFGRSGLMSSSRSPVTPRTPTRTQVSSSPSSFVVSAQFSPYKSSPHVPY